jgi:ABC-type hemin transport system ATPase subunit
MKLIRLAIQGFTVFGRPAVFELAPAVNVLIGENGTGKSHVLKLIYALSEAVRRFGSGEKLEDGLPPTLRQLVRAMLWGVFQPDALDSFLASLPGRATVTLDWEEARLEVTLGPGKDPIGEDAIEASVSGAFSKVGRAVFIPPREVLSMFPGFVEAWLRRESAFDRTYFDLCVALGLLPLRTGGRADLLEPIEHALGGKVLVRNGRFYLAYPGGDMEVPLVAEGDRKLAMVAYLLMNGTLSENACLLWDEPEANLNPKRALLTADSIVGLGRAGVQVVVATHDYALSSELSLKVEKGALQAGEAAFFGLHRDENPAEVEVERGATLPEVQNNPILDAFEALHRREEVALYAAGPGAP